MDDRQRLAVAIGMEYACYSMAEAVEELKRAIDFDVSAFRELFLSLNKALMADKVLHPWGRGIYKRASN